MGHINKHGRMISARGNNYFSRDSSKNLCSSELLHRRSIVSGLDAWHENMDKTEIYGRQHEQKEHRARGFKVTG